MFSLLTILNNQAFMNRQNTCGICFPRGMLFIMETQNIKKEQNHIISDFALFYNLFNVNLFNIAV